MKRIQFDVGITFNHLPTAPDLLGLIVTEMNEAMDRTYYATTAPYSIVIVKPQSMSLEAGRVYDCLIGNHPCDDYQQYCREGMNSTATKITILRECKDQRTEDALMSEVIRSAWQDDGSRERFSAEQIKADKNLGPFEMLYIEEMCSFANGKTGTDPMTYVAFALRRGMYSYPAIAELIDFARHKWHDSQGDAISVPDAARLVYGTASQYTCARIEQNLKVYPNPHTREGQRGGQNWTSKAEAERLAKVLTRK